MNPNCLRCWTPFKAELPGWQVTATCDLCASYLVTYVATSTNPRQAANRIRASRRLYARVEAIPATEALPCEVDFTPEPAPDYDDVEGPVTVVMDEIGIARQLDNGWLMYEMLKGRARRPIPGDADYDSPTHIDPMYEAIERSEARARARALARPGSLGFDG